MRALTIRVRLVCPTGAESCHAKLREVLEPIENARGTDWPSLEQWERLLPEWFVSRLAKPMSREEAEIWMKKWRTAPRAAQARMAHEAWSLPDWLYWMEPGQSPWTWVNATVRNDRELEVTLGVDGWPTPLEAFEWLARSADVEEIAVLS